MLVEGNYNDGEAVERRRLIGSIAECMDFEGAWPYLVLSEQFGSSRSRDDLLSDRMMVA